jgi:hypothetical protein
MRLQSCIGDDPFLPVLRIRIRMVLGLLDPDPGPKPDPSTIKQKQEKTTVLRPLFDIFFLKNDVNVLLKVISRKTF